MAASGSSRNGEPKDDVVQALLGASRALVGVAARSLAPIEGVLTLVQFRALVWLAEHGPVNVGTLADAAGIHPSTATRLSDRLVERKFVERSVPSGDRREVILGVAPAGQALIRTVTEQRRTELRRLVADLDRASRDAVVAALTRFNEVAGELPDDAWQLGWP